jgi:hypothetical protein
MRWLLAILLWGSGYGFTGMAQDLTGQWTGDVTNTDRRQKLVLNITSGDSSFGGVLHWYFPGSHYIKHIVISGRYYGKDSILTIREDSVVGGRPEGGRDPLQDEKALARPPGGFYVLYYKRIGHKDLLEGHWRSPGNSIERHPDMSIRLEKKIPPFIPVILPSHRKKDSIQQKQLDSFLGRPAVVAARIPVRDGIDSIRIDLFDNGEIDGDSVSVYLNNELVAAHIRLTAEAKTLMVPIDRSIPVNKLVLFAENLGRLPPNTALMEVTVHGKTYELFLSTDFKRNASVEFSLQE